MAGPDTASMLFCPYCSNYLTIGAPEGTNRWSVPSGSLSILMRATVFISFRTQAM